MTSLINFSINTKIISKTRKISSRNIILRNLRKFSIHTRCWRSTRMLQLIRSRMPTADLRLNTIPRITVSLRLRRNSRTLPEPIRRSLRQRKKKIMGNSDSIVSSKMYKERLMPYSENQNKRTTQKRPKLTKLQKIKNKHPSLRQILMDNYIPNRAAYRPSTDNRPSSSYRKYTKKTGNYSK